MLTQTFTAMFSAWLPYLVVGVAFVALCYLLGLLIVKYLFADFGGLRPFSKLFFSILTGVMALVAVYSIIVTGGKTVYIGFVLVFGLLFWENRKPAKLPLTEDNMQEPMGKQWLYGFAILSLVLFSFLGMSKIYVGGPFPWVVYLGADYAYHSMLSETLSITGYENKFIPEQMLSEGFPGIHLFHFFDLWIASALAKLSGLNNYVMHNTVVDPFFMLLSSLGFLALFEQMFKIKPIHYAMALLVMGFGYLHFTFYNAVSYLSPEHYRIHHFGATVLVLPKLFQVVPFAFAVAYFLLRRQYALMTLWVVALAMVYMSAIPVMLASTFAFLVLWRLLKQIDTNKAILIPIAYIIGAGVFFIVLYKLFGIGISEGKDKLDLELFGMAALKTRINIAGLTIMQTLVLFFPHILLLGIAFWVGRKDFRKLATVGSLLLYAAIIFGMGLFAWVATFKNQDGMQLLGNNFPVINVLLLLALTMIYFDGYHSYVSLPAWARKAVPVLLLLLMAGNYMGHLADIPDTHAKRIKDHDPNYLVAISKTNTDVQVPLNGVFFKGNAEYTNNPQQQAHRTSQSYKLGMYTVFMQQYLSTTSLTVFDMPRSKDELNYAREENAISGSSFYAFVERQKVSGNYLSIPDSQWQYIEHYDIKYAIASASAIVPAEVLGKAKEIITDPVSGERFLLF